MVRIIVTALVLIALYSVRDRLPIPLFRLSGDIKIATARATLFLPISSCVVVSVLMSIVFSIFGWR